MDEAASVSLLSGYGLTWLVTFLALVVVWVPFFRGLRLSFQGWTATRKMDKTELAQALANGDTRTDVEPLSALMLRVLKKSLQSREHPADFVFDATRQYAMNEFDLFYTRPISMFAGLLPPIGFIGTTIGMLILFVSMHQSNASLELSALAVALTSSIFALIGFAILEGIKIRLYSRLLLAVRVVENLYIDIELRHEEKASSAKSSGSGPVKGTASAPA